MTGRDDGSAVPVVTRPSPARVYDFLHFVADSDRPAAILAWLRSAVAPGPYLVICHASRPADMTSRHVAVTREYSDRAPG